LPRLSKAVVPRESEEQQLVITWAKWQEKAHPELRWLHAIPNGEWRNIVTARRLIGEGVKKGVPDLCLPVPRGLYHGLYIEMKRLKGSRESDEQKEWLEYLNSAGYLAITCKGADIAINAILDYLKRK